MSAGGSPGRNRPEARTAPADLMISRSDGREAVHIHPAEAIETEWLE